MPGRGGDALGRIERALTLLVRRAEKVDLHAQGASEPLERTAYAFLGMLNDEGPMRAAELAGRFHLDASTVSRQISTLVDRGLVVREPAEDRRALWLLPTPGGREALAATRAARRRVVRDLLDGSSPQDLAAFASFLEQLNAGMDCQAAGTGGFAEQVRPDMAARGEPRRMPTAPARVPQARTADHTRDAESR